MLSNYSETKIIFFSSVAITGQSKTALNVATAEILEHVGYFVKDNYHRCVRWQVRISHLFSKLVNTSHSNAFTGSRTIQSKDPFHTWFTSVEYKNIDKIKAWKLEIYEGKSLMLNAEKSCWRKANILCDSGQEQETRNCLVTPQITQWWFDNHY